MFVKTIHKDALCHWNTQNGSVEKDGNLTVFLLFNWLKQHIDENYFQNIFLLQLRNLRHPKLLILPQVRLKKPDVCAWKWVGDVKLYKSIYMYMEISNCLDLIWFFFFISTQNYFISTCTIWQCNGFSPNINIADINNLFPIYLYTFALLMLSSYDTVIYNWWFAGCPLMPSPLGEQYFRMQVGIMGLIDFACPVQQKYVYEKCMCSYWNVQVCMSLSYQV